MHRWAQRLEGKDARSQGMLTLILKGEVSEPPRPYQLALGCFENERETPNLS